jgi:formate/nitrite transporter FocA (FNT family)
MDEPNRDQPGKPAGADPESRSEDGGFVAATGTATDEGGVVTERALERSREERHYVPVILKRTDESQRHPDDILASAIADGLEQLKRPGFSLYLSAVAAGLILSFTAMAVAVVAAVTVGESGTLVQRLATAFVYPLGFVLCIMSGTELFTEHTATAVYPVLDRQASIPQMLRLWLLVGLGNLTGATAGAGLLVFAESVVGARAGYLDIGHHLVEYGGLPLFASSLLAGWLMALGVWLIHATSPGISQIVSIYIVTFLIGLGGLHHSIAGAVEMLTALFLSDHLTVAGSLGFIAMALFGNLVGGSLFVAVLNYGHIRRTQKAEDVEAP